MRFLISVAAISALFASPLVAQPVGSQYRPSKKEPVEIRKISNGYADCIVRKKPELAREAILSNATNEQIAKKYRRLISGGCLVKANKGKGGQMAFGDDLFRYNISGALIRADLQNHVPRDFNDVPALEHIKRLKPKPELMAGTNRKAKKHQGAVKKRKAMRALSIYGECVVRSDPVNSFALAMSDIGSDEETAAFAKLQPSFGPCLNGEGDYRFTRSVLRGLVNVNYYRLAMAGRKSQVEMTETAQTEAHN